jgi:hypothetical protein
VIPNSVESIQGSAFYECKALTEIVLPSRMEVGRAAFSGCNKLEKVTLNGGELGEYAFSGCYKLAEIRIYGVTQFGYNVFNNTNRSVDIYVKDIAVWNDCTFHSYMYGEYPLCEESEFYLNESLLTDLVVPSTIKNIRKEFFSGYSKLKSVVIPNTVTSIGANAFNGCNQIESMTVPFIGASLQEMGNSKLSYFFDGYSLPASLKTVVLKGGTKLGNSAFAGSGITGITLPDSLTSIGWRSNR